MEKRKIEATVGIPVEVSVPVTDRARPIVGGRLVTIGLHALLQEIERIALLRSIFIHSKDSSPRPGWITLGIKIPDGLEEDRADDYAILKVTELLLETCPKSDE